jgi:nucleoside-diphosphate-sugar epimerase
MKLLVTGATSLLGRSLVERLTGRGDTVSVLQRHPSGLAVTEYLGDVVDRQAVADSMAGAEAVVHLAARVAVTGSWAEFEAVNVRGTRNVIGAAQAAGVRRFVQVSSPSVAHHGESLVGAPAGPANPARARGNYARSKAHAELVALAANSSDMAVVAVRPHLVWGPGDTQLIGRIVDRARAGRLATVGSGAALIDTTYIDNAVDALVAAIDRAPELGGRAFVVTNGEPRPVRELLNRIVRSAGLEPTRARVPYHVARGGGFVAERIWERRGSGEDPPMTSFLAEQLGTAHWFDQRETRMALEWEPQVNLAEGFENLRAWFEGSSS